MASRDVVAYLQAGEPRTGGWCDVCCLPSLIEVDITVTSETARGDSLGVSAGKATFCTSHEDGDDET